LDSCLVLFPHRVSHSHPQSHELKNKSRQLADGDEQGPGNEGGPGGAGGGVHGLDEAVRPLMHPSNASAEALRFWLGLTEYLLWHNTSGMPILSLFSGSIKALIRLYDGSVKALLRLYFASIKALLCLYMPQGSMKAL
jgi:hypothetical protein